MTPFSKQALAILLVSTLAACSVGPAKRDSDDSGASPFSSSSTSSPARDTRDADRRFNAALQLMRERKQQEAQAAFQALSKDFPEFSGPLTALGILYAQGKQRDQALASFAKAVAANPDNAVALNWLGSLYREIGDFKRAEQTYRKALAARSDYASAHLNLGILYDVALRQPQNALAEYREYQRLAGSQNLMVGVWIKEIEASSTTRTAEAGSAQ